MMMYKGYTALLEVDIASGTLVGHVIGIHDEIVFQGKTVEEAQASFCETVDFYLRRRAELGQEPARPFSGRFNVRIDPEMHRALVLDAEARAVSLNEVVKRAFATYLQQSAVRVDDGGEAVGESPRAAMTGAAARRGSRDPAVASTSGPPSATLGDLRSRRRRGRETRADQER